MREQWTLEKINQLITNQEQENLNLEYKSSGAKDNTQIAVKIVDDRGIESLKVISVGANG